MQQSMFNLRVPLPARGEVFLMNTLTDAQLIVSPDVVDLLDRIAGPAALEAIRRGATARHGRTAQGCTQPFR